MLASELKEICKIVNMSGLIDEFMISKDGHVIGVDVAKTAVVDLKYNIQLSENICISNVGGVIESLDKFLDDTNVEITDNKLKLTKDHKFYVIPLKTYEEPKFNLPTLTESNYQVIAEDVDHNILNKLGKLRVQKLMDELYHFYTLNNNLMFQIGEDMGVHAGDFIGITKKCESNEVMKFTMNISECFKSISTKANINLLFGKVDIPNMMLMMIECNTEKYNVKYYLAPRVK